MNIFLKLTFFISKTIAKTPLYKGLNSFIFSHFSHIKKSGLAAGLKVKGGIGLMEKYYRPGLGENFLKQLNLEGKVVYDIGAHKGIYTLFFCKKVGLKGWVYSFEPNPKNTNLIKEHLQINGFSNVTIYSFALGDEEIEVNLQIPFIDDSRASIVKEKYSMINQNEKCNYIRVKVYPIDDVIKKNNLKIPDFLKIDVEGAEYDVLKGALNIIKNNKPDIYLEIHGKGKEDWVSNARRIIEFLTRNGYKIKGILNEQILTPVSLNSIIYESGPIFCYAK